MPNSLLRGILAALRGEDRAVKRTQGRRQSTKTVFKLHFTYNHSQEPDFIQFRLLIIMHIYECCVNLPEYYLESVNFYLGTGCMVGQHLKKNKK